MNTNKLLFVVGLSRSGTKLIRDLLNRNEKISIPIWETHFFPAMIKQFSNNYDFDKVFDQFSKSGYFYKYLNSFLEYEECKNILSECSGIKEFLVKSLEFSLLKKKSYDPDSIILGDKTPGYIGHAELLLDYFEDSKMIHIIRDPRDRALSVRKTWGNSILISANDWNEKITYFNKIKGKYPTNRILEIHYENLISEPNKVLSNVCNFLDIEFSETMLTLDRVIEPKGISAKSNKIYAPNKNKFEYELTKNNIKKIEQICFNSMKNKPYQILYAKESKQLNIIIIFYLKIFNKFKYIANKIKKKGIFNLPSILYYNIVKKIE